MCSYNLVRITKSKSVNRNWQAKDRSEMRLRLEYVQDTVKRRLRRTKNINDFVWKAKATKIWSVAHTCSHFLLPDLVRIGRALTTTESLQVLLRSRQFPDSSQVPNYVRVGYHFLLNRSSSSTLARLTKHTVHTTGGLKLEESRSFTAGAFLRGSTDKSETFRRSVARLWTCIVLRLFH